MSANVIQAKNNRPHKGIDGESTQDKEAGYKCQSRDDFGCKQVVYGFKAHIGAEEEDFVKSTEFMAGNVYDSQYFKLPK